MMRSSPHSLRALHLAAALALGAPPVAAQTVPVASRVETAPVPTSGDAADDAAVWIHPTAPDQSTIIGTDKDAGLAVYDLAGGELQFLPDGEMNNVDLRYGFPLDGAQVDLVAASDRTANAIAVYRVDPATRGLVDVAVGGGIPTGFAVYGFCLYKSSATGAFHAFVNSKDGEVEQWQLFDAGGGLVDGTLVRSFAVGSQTEGCVADDIYGDFYIGEEEVGIWRYGAEPGDGTVRTQVDTTGPGGQLTADVEGLALYYATATTGYLLASSQGSSEFVAYEREGANAYVGTFSLVAGGGIDVVTGTDGIDVTNAALGAGFPSGLFVAQDTLNDVGNQNYKLAGWEDVAGGFSPPLVVDTSWNPRLGCSGGDEDGDEICDGEDNCRLAANPLQIDTDADGYGNACDADYDNDGAVAGTDFFHLAAALGLSAGDPGYDPAVDYDADDAVAGTDFLFMASELGGRPGPSGLACAGTIPCPE